RMPALLCWAMGVTRATPSAWSNRSRAAKAFSRKTPSAFRQSASGVHPAEPARETPELGCPGDGRDPARIRSRKATVVWVARFSTRVGHEPQPAGSPRQGHPANPATRECDDHDEHLREDGFA